MEHRNNDIWYDEIRNLWTETQERVLIKWFEETMALFWKHKETSKMYAFRDKCLGIPSVALTAITGTAVFITLDDTSKCDESNGKLYIQVIIGVIIILVTVLIAIQNFLGLAQRAEKHEATSNKFKSFANSIETELSLPRIQRLNGKIFIKQVQKRYSELLEIAPSIPERIERRYQEQKQTEELLSLKEIIVDDGKYLPMTENKTKTHLKNKNEDKNEDENGGGEDTDVESNTSEKSINTNIIQRVEKIENFAEKNTQNSLQTEIEQERKHMTQREREREHESGSDRGIMERIDRFANL